MGQGQAIFFTGVGKVEARAFDLAEPGPGEILVRSEVTLISPGTELRCLAGAQPGSAPFPFIPGYVTVGRVERCGAGASIEVGSRVLCDGTRQAGLPWQWGGHVSHAITQASWVVRVPDGLTPERAAVAKLAGIALRGVKVSKPQPGERVAVVGLGTIGSLSARLFRQSGARVVAFDTQADRVETVKSAGVEACLVDGVLEEAVRGVFEGGADVVVDATGNPAVLPHSMRAARGKPWGQSGAFGSKLVVQGSYPGDFSLPYQESFERELTILFPRDTDPADKVEAMGLIAAGGIYVEDLVAHPFSPGQAAEAYEGLVQRGYLTGHFDWRALGRRRLRCICRSVWA